MHRNWFSRCSTPRRTRPNIDFSHRLKQNSKRLSPRNRCRL